jgi:hypothetical protein
LIAIHADHQKLGNRRALNDSYNWDEDTPQEHKDAFMKSFGVTADYLDR